MHMKKWIFKAFQFLLLLTPGLFLFYLDRFQVGIPTNLLEFSVGGLFLFWLLGLGFLGFPRPMLGRWHRAALIFFLAAATLATAKTVLTLELGQSVPLGIWKGWFVMPACYYLMLVSSFRTRSELGRVVDVTLALVALTSAVMLLQFFTGIFSEVMSTPDLRLVWPYLDPWSGLGASGNYPALFLSPFLCLGFMMLIRSEKSMERFFYAATSLIIALTVYFTKSYGAWIAVIGACSIGSFFIFSGVKRWVMTPLFALLLVIGLYADQKNTEKFRFGLDLGNQSVITSSEERLNIWKVSWDLIQRDPLFGVGPGQFQRSFAQQAPVTLQRDVSRGEINHALHSHNTFLMFWLSNGILGLLSYLFLVGVWAIFVPKEWRWTLLAPLLYLLAHGLIDVTYFKNDLATSFFFLGGLMTIARSTNLVSGTVEEGLKIGKSLGYPTINLQFASPPEKPYGVYSASVVIDGKKRMGLLYYGPRMVKGLADQIVCEMTILDFEADLYGKRLPCVFGEFIRPPKSFSGLGELKKQIEKDVLVAKHRRII